MNKINLKFAILLYMVFLPGCDFYTADNAPDTFYYLNPNKDLYNIGTAALIELENDSTFPKISVDVTETLFRTLQKKQIVSISLIRQNAPSYRSLQLDLNTEYTYERLANMRRELRCNSILTGTVTEFRPYPHMAIGLRLRLVDLSDGQLLWAIEQIWDTADKATQKRIEEYYRYYIFSDSESLSHKLATVSSLKFIKFVAYEISETLQTKTNGQ